MASTSPPQIQPPQTEVEPEQCPEAISKWLNYTTSPQDALEGPFETRTALSLKAKRHLCFLGWEIWYARKGNGREMRYKSPTGKTYKSLRQACIACINEGRGESENAPLLQENNPLFLSTTGSSVHHTSSGKPNILFTKKRKQPMSGTCLEKPSSSADVKKGKATKGVRNSDSDSSGSNKQGYLAWLINNQPVLTYSPVRCPGDVEKTGKLFSWGIVCDCCHGVFSIGRFVAHTDFKKHRPSSKIILEDGRSLLDCQEEVLKKSAGKNMSCLMKEGDEDFVNDSICSVCGLGDEIRVCNGCPSSFHPQCLGVDALPKADWFCPRCVCKFCNQAKYKEDCVGNVDGNLLSCDQCELKYHIGCVKDKGLANEKNRFCNGHCKKIYRTLHELIGKPSLVGKMNLTWLKACDEASIQNLRAALAVLRECFERITDAFFGKDIMSAVIFSRVSELDRLNCRGFYTMVLEHSGEVISVAAIRIFDQKVAEIPLVGTKEKFRNRGMCHILMKEVEKQLTSLGVERMILPSSRNMTKTWISSFGFQEMTRSHKYQLRNYSFLHLPGTIKCHKSLIKASVA